MLKEKSVVLIQELNILIQRYASNDKVRKIIVDEFTERNMKGSLAISILNEKRELSTLNIDEGKDLILLFVFTKGMFKAMTYKENENDSTLGEISEGLKITPENYFNKIEIENMSDYKEDKKTNTKQQHVFHNMIQVADGYWKGIVSAQQLATIEDANDIIYSFKTQRDPHIDIYGMKRIRLDTNKVEKIANRLLSGTQFSDEIKLNLLHDGEDQISYDKNGNLTIISGNLNIFDGYHRMTASSIFVTKSKEESGSDDFKDFNWGLVITNFSEKKTQEFMVQINEQKPMKQEHIKALDTSKLGNIVSEVIRDIDTSEFAQNIRESEAELKFSGMVRKSLLSQSIEECYKTRLTNRLQAKPIAKHIAQVMDYIIGLNIDAFIVNPDHDHSYIAHRNMFAGYVALSEKLYDVNGWEDILEEVMDKIDFSTENLFWKNIGLLETDMKKSTRNNLYKFFQKLV